MCIRDRDCDISITLYYEDRDPIELAPVQCPSKRTHHIRMDQSTDRQGNAILRGVPYAAMLHCSVPVYVQYTRVDTAESTNAIMTTIAL